MFIFIMLKRGLSIALATTLMCTLFLGIPILKDFVTKSDNNFAYAADPAVNWMKNYGGSNGEAFNSVEEATGGGYVAVGYSISSDGDLPLDTSTRSGIKFAIAKFDNKGNKKWLKAYGGTGNDSLYSVTRANGGGYIAVGYSSSVDGDLPPYTSTKPGINFVIAKFDENGDKQWIKTYGGYAVDYLTSVIRAPGGGYIAVGYSSSYGGDLPPYTSAKPGTNFVIAKFDNDGEKQWIKTYGGTGADYFQCVTQAIGGGYVAAGYTTSSNGDLPPDTDTRSVLKFVVAKFDVNGEKQWINAYGGTGYDYFRSIIQTPDGGYVAAGYSNSTNGDLPGNKGNNDGIVAKFDKNGNTMWFKNFGGSAGDLFYDVAPAVGNCFVASGVSSSTNGDIPNNKGLQDIVLLKFDSNGNKIWLNNYGGSDHDYCTSITQASGGGHAVTGESMSADGDLSGNKGYSDFIIARITEEFVITLNTNGGKKLSPGKKTVINGGKYGNLPSPTRKGHTFTGWYTEKKNGKKITKESVVTIIKDITLYANWKAKKYTVRFCDQKGKQLYKNGKKLTKKVTYGKKYGALQKPRDKIGRYQFLGWYTKKIGGKKITAKSTVKITKTTKLYTHWKRKW